MNASPLSTWQKWSIWVQDHSSKRAPKKEKENFLENLTLLLESGMGMDQVLQALYLDAKSLAMKTFIQTLKNQIQGGVPLWLALQNNKLLSFHYINLIRIGEESGQLVKNLKAVTLQQKKEGEFRSKIRSAMLYPILVLIVTLCVGVAITWLILPRLAHVFDQLNLDLPFLTRFLIASGQFLKQYGWFAVPLATFFCGLLIYIFFFYSKTSHLGQRFLLRSFISRKIIQEMELSRFGYVSGSLLEAGIPIEKIMDSLEESTHFLDHKLLYRAFKQKIEQGSSFPEIFAHYPHVERLIPVSVQQMINSAYSSGHLSHTLLTIGEKYELKMESTARNLPIILEPILLVIIWLGVVAVALAVILPIYDLVGGFSMGPQF